MSELLLEEYRGNLLENEHRGVICGVDASGRIKYAVGDPEQFTYFRSSAKPIQAIPAIRRAVDAQFGLTEREIVLFTASHRGEPFHVETVESLLGKLGLKEEQLLCSPTYPNNPDAKLELHQRGSPPRRVYHNCAGKHLGIMALCKSMGVSVERYWELDHPVQQAILETIALIAEYPPELIRVGVDGCGVPVFALPLHKLANAYVRLACPYLIEDQSVREAVVKITGLMNKHNEIVTGTKFICSTLLEDENIIAKGGAKGVYCFGLKQERLAFALKIMDGTEEGWPLIIASILEQIGYTNKRTINSLYGLAGKEIWNDNKELVGHHRVVFQL